MKAKRKATVGIALHGTNSGLRDALYTFAKALLSSNGHQKMEQTILSRKGSVSTDRVVQVMIR